MKYIFLIQFFCLAVVGQGQNQISGKVVSSSGHPVKNANVILVGTYDGATTDEDGQFSFESNEIGTFELEIDANGFVFQTIFISIPVEAFIDIQLEEATELDVVIFSAGTMKAIGNTNETMMSSLDVVTTAGSDGDLIAAVQTLPGTNHVSEDGRLFIRGGEADESAIFIDRLRVFQPYTQTAPNTPARGRYSPFLFKGINFSTGGYEVPFGQALSGILTLETQDFPTENSYDLSFMTLGLGVAANRVWERDAISLSTEYHNLWPAFQVIKTRDEWTHAPEGYGGEAVYRHKFKKGLFKSYVAMDYSKLGVLSQDINQTEKVPFKMNNTNLYWNTSYVHDFSKKLVGFVGFSTAKSNTNVDQNFVRYETEELGLNVKSEFEWKLNAKNHVKFGGEYVGISNKNRDVTNEYFSDLDENLLAVYGDYTWYFVRKLGLKLGIRGEYSDYVKKWNLSPRISLAYKLNSYHNFSILYGAYYQSPLQELNYTQPTGFMKSQQYLVNYFYQKEKQTIRIEVYQKEYNNLVRYGDSFDYFQNGSGMARGLDIFWKNNGSHFKNLQYWISYSFIDTKRLYKDFPEKAQPSFVANHNLSFVGKYWVASWRSQIGFTYQFASGRPFDNPNSTEFMNEKTKSFNIFNISWAYLLDPQKILYFSISNPFGIRNINGYTYSNSPNENGVYDRMAMRPSTDRFFFVGFFWTISKNKDRNQLDTL